MRPWITKFAKGASSTPGSTAYFFARTMLADEDSVRITFDQLLQSAKIP
jgi:hypothetical protein